MVKGRKKKRSRGRKKERRQGSRSRIFRPN
jgi:hypothetical protein